MTSAGIHCPKGIISLMKSEVLPAKSSTALTMLIVHNNFRSAGLPGFHDAKHGLTLMDIDAGATCIATILFLR